MHQHHAKLHQCRIALRKPTQGFQLAGWFLRASWGPRGGDEQKKPGRLKQKLWLWFALVKKLFGRGALMLNIGSCDQALECRT